MLDKELWTSFKTSCNKYISEIFKYIGWWSPPTQISESYWTVFTKLSAMGHSILISRYCPPPCPILRGIGGQHGLLTNALLHRICQCSGITLHKAVVCGESSDNAHIMLWCARVSIFKCTYICNICMLVGWSLESYAGYRCVGTFLSPSSDFIRLP